MFDEKFLDALATAIAEKVIAKGVLAPRMLELEQAATYLGMTVDALRTKATLRQVPSVRVDRKWRFDREKLDKWISDHGQAA